MHPVFQDVEAGAAGERHVDIGMVVAEDEVVHIVSLLKLCRKLIQRLFRALEFIFPIVRQAAVMRPSVAKTIGKPRMQHAEKDLKETAMEDAADDSVAKRNVSESVTVSEAESNPGDIHDTWLFKTFHAEFLKVAVGPDVMVSREEIYIHSAVHEFLQGGECADISFRNHITVFIPEVPDVAEQIDRFGVFRQGTQEVGETALAGGGISHLQA